MAFEFLFFETVVEEFAHERGVVGERNETFADIARRENIKFLAKTA
jgi:hypothetical protein